MSGCRHLAFFPPVVLAVVLVEACRPAGVPEPSDVAALRVLVERADLVLPLARAACPVLPRPAECRVSVGAASALVATARPLLATCADADPVCESERLDAVRASLPGLRRAVADLLAIAAHEAPASPAAPASAPVASASASAPSPAPAASTER